jgi:hypothetical protein
MRMLIFVTLLFHVFATETADACFLRHRQRCNCVCLSTLPAIKRQITPDQAKNALLEIMRTQPKVFVNRFDVEEWSKAELERLEAGWFAWGGSFRIKPSEAIYIITIRPAPEAKACTFEVQGSFVLDGGRWIAQPPSKMLSAALGGEK